MGRKHLFLACGLVGAMSSVVACIDYGSDVSIFLQEPGPDGQRGTGGGGGGTTSSTTIDPGCIPSQTPNPVRDDCGIFVSSSKGDDKNDGKSKGKPFATITKALASADSGPIYLCGESFAEAVKIKSGRTIYGGLDCAKDWSWSAATKSEVSPTAGEVPLVVDPQIGFAAEDVVWRAKDAVEAGASSIAVIVTNGAEVTFTRCDIEAGNAKDGATGEAFAMSASAGAMGNPGLDACTADVVIGGKSVQNACDDADPNDDSISGSGGIGQDSAGGPGGDGQPGATVNGGKGENNANACTAGTVGDDGAVGMSATGATGDGTIGPQGYAGATGNSGEKGKPGQGGGGGGGAKGGTAANQCADAMKAGGASGGSGGAGGCGGLGGLGGQAGGASIGIVSIGASLTFDAVKITTKAGGHGGAGGLGQLGGKGGDGGLGGSKGGASALKDGCAGGPGGSGGPGGRGGGGAGGPSIGIAFTGDAPSLKGATITEGTPGDGGAGDGAMGAGAMGAAAKTQKF